MSIPENVLRYAPFLMINDNEPFPLKTVGYTIFTEPGPSTSFERTVHFDTNEVAFAVEYAYYWDYDIGHMYDLEHAWVFVGHNGKTVACQCSFHGHFANGLRPDHGNLWGNHPVLFCQPGKHGLGFDPMVLMTNGGYFLTDDPKRVNGLLITPILEGRMENTPEIAALANGELIRNKFVPARTFHLEEAAESLYMPWPELWAAIPGYVEAELVRLRAQK